MDEFKQENERDGGAEKYLDYDGEDAMDDDPLNNLYKNVSEKETVFLQPFEKMLYIINKNEIDCVSMPDTPVALAESVGVRVLKSEKKSSGGFFSSSWVVYDIYTDLYKTHVKRRFKHFEWLDLCLHNRFPICYIPGLPPKVMQLRFDDELTAERRISLQQYLDQVCCNPTLKYSPELALFLSASEEEFNKIVADPKPKRIIPNASQFLASNTPFKVHEIVQPGGKINLMMDVELRAVTRDITDSIGILSPLDEQAVAICSEISDTQDKLSKLYRNLSVVCEKLQRNYLELEKIVKFPNVLKLAELYEGIKEYLAEHSKMVNDDCRNLHDHIRPIFEFSLRELQGITRIAEERNVFSGTYTEKKHQLRKKKAKLYRSGDVTRWGLDEKMAGKVKAADPYNKVEMHMLSNETRNLRWMRHMWAYMNAQVIKEMDLFMRLKFNRSSQLIKTYTLDFLSAAKRLKQTFETLAPKLLDSKDAILPARTTIRATRSGTLFGFQLLGFAN